MNLRIAAAVVLRSLTYAQTELDPTYAPTQKPLLSPTLAPSYNPTYSPTARPTGVPTIQPTYPPSLSTTTKSTEQDTSQASPNAASNKSSTNSESGNSMLIISVLAGVTCIACTGIALYILAHRSEGKDKICSPSEGKDKTEETSNESSPVAAVNLNTVIANATFSALNNGDSVYTTPIKPKDNNIEETNP